MRRRLPPLNSLRAFEVAARHLSFTRAAEELCVTQGAVSRQVKQLEDYLQLELVRRKNQTLSLTEDGEVYMSALGRAFDMLDSATRRLQGKTDQLSLGVRVLPTLAMRWLIPRLYEFHRLHPEIQVRITTSLHPGDFTIDDFDIAIGRKPEWQHGIRFDRVMPEDLIVVCSPALLAGDNPIRQPADLGKHNLLHAATRPEAWKVWLSGVGLENFNTDGIKFEHYYYVIQAAISGLGVAVTPRPLVIDDLASGQLAAPFDVSIPTHDGYYLIYAEKRADLAKIQAFRRWILAISADPSANAMHVGAPRTRSKRRAAVRHTEAKL